MPTPTVPAAPQPTSHSQNLGLVVLVVGIFMVIITFVSVSYFNGNKIDTIKTTQDKNSQVGKAERGNLTDITCALWRSIGDPRRVDATLRAQVEAVCASAATPTASP
jgi:flagellar basal body-associated protein FliL